MHKIIGAEQLRILLNDTRLVMGEQPWAKAIDDRAQPVNIPHGKMEALHCLEHGECVFVPVMRTQEKSGKVIEHGFEVRRRESGWEVVTAALEITADKSAKVHPETARNLQVQQELEKLRLRISQPKPIV
jgi:hypothetical protein